MNYQNQGIPSQPTQYFPPTNNVPQSPPIPPVSSAPSPNPISPATSETPEKKSNMLTLILIMVGLLLVGGIASYYVLNRPGEAISITESQLASGKDVSMSKNSKIQLESNEENHTLDVKLDDDSILISEEGTSLKISVFSNNLTYLDLNNDGINDVSILMNKKSDGSFLLKINKVAIAPEDDEIDEGLISETQARADEESQNETGEESQDDTEEESQDENDTEEESQNNTSEPIINEISSEGDNCSAKGLYDYVDDGTLGCDYPDTITHYTSSSNEAYSCCSSEPTYLVAPEEITALWDDLENSGDCVDYDVQLSSCTPYKCNYTNNAFTLEKGPRAILGMQDGKCHTINELPNNGEQYCQFNSTQLSRMVDYLVFIKEQCGDNFNCTTTINSTGYFINDIEADPIENEMITSEDCLISGY